MSAQQAGRACAAVLTVAVLLIVLAAVVGWLVGVAVRVWAWAL